MDEGGPSSEEMPKQAEQSEFKKPILFGRVGKLPRKVRSEADRPPEPKPIENSSSDDHSADSSNSRSSLPPAVLLKELSTPIPYKEPKWSGVCPDGSGYALEVLKSGMIVENVELTKKPFYVFGRLANCDVVMGHPTVSRHHAVLQYKAFAEDSEPSCGWYLYDLGSTHGTFLNKEKLKPSHYTRVRVGHQIKFGTSTRTYIMMGPDFDCEGESDLSVTEIKKKAEELKLERDRMIKEAAQQREMDRLEEERKREEQGIDWGMGEDAEDETDLTENPYASTANEELYLEDPKKTLRGYFEREGHELTYNCEERGPGQFLCRVELPIDDARGNPVQAEVLHRGKKKEAVIACALEACRALDRAGLLRQATHESRRRKQRDWSADDYYDSDEDTFLDRTGSVEKKRKQRMVKMGAVEGDSNRVLTYDDLLKQITAIEEKIALEEKTLERLRSTSKPTEPCESETDALDAFMSTLGRQSMAQKAEISKTKMSIQKLKSELAKTQRLAEVARPPHLPPLVKKDENKMAVRLGSNSVVYGKRIRLKEDTERQKKVRKETKQEDTEFVEEMDSDDEDTNTNKQTDIQNHTLTEEKQSPKPTNIQNYTQNEEHKTPKSDIQEERQNILTKGKEKDSNRKDIQTENNTKSETKSQEEKRQSIKTKGKERDSNTAKKEDTKRVFGPMRPPENYVIPENYFDQETDRDLPEIEEKES